MKTNLLLMLALAASTTLFVSACDRDPDPAVTTDPADSGMSFADMDTNKDGGIAQDELASTEMLAQHFTRADTDGDGKLSQAEVDKYRADMAAAPGG